MTHVDSTLTEGGSLARRSPIRTGLLWNVLAVGSLWAAIAAFFWRIGLAGRVLAGGDAFTYFYPYWAEATRALRSGRLPLWNPYLFAGAPFLANSQAGVLYPPNWLLWATLPPHVSIHVSILLHLGLAGWMAWLWARRSLHLRRGAAWVTGVSYALGGYLVAQVEHVNQLQGLAWLPLVLLLVDLAVRAPHAARRQRTLALIGLTLVIALILLAGHTQTAFISMGAAAAYGLGPSLWAGLRSLGTRLRYSARRHAHPAGQSTPSSPWSGRRFVLDAARLAAALALGVLLAAAQLLPTLELSRQSMRAGGLPFRERVSFSLSPFYLARALLPGYDEPVPPTHIEHVAYIGIAGLVCAVTAVLVYRQPRTRTRPRDEHSEMTGPEEGIREPLQGTYLLVALGLFLALGGYNPLYLLLARYVPGFAHFRVPARWLALYALGAAGLAGLGVQAIWQGLTPRRGRGHWYWAGAFVLLIGWAVQGPRFGEGATVGWVTGVAWAAAALVGLGLTALAGRAPRVAALSLAGVLLAELSLAASCLPQARATAPQAYTSMRPAIAHLRAGAPGRFLSMSDITFDPGDLAEIDVIYGRQLPADALYEYVVAAKLKEVLSPNLSMVFGVPAVDGYDGGVLPLARYAFVQQLLQPEGPLSLDGRLRENLSEVPDGRWLSVFNVRYVITDKLRDAWLDDVFYDLQFGARLAGQEDVAVADVPRFESTALGLVSYLDGGQALSDGALIGTLEVTFDDGAVRVFELRAGEHSAEGRYDADVSHQQAVVGGHFWPGEPEGADYVARLRWDTPATPTEIRIRAVLAEGELVLRGASLIDERTGGFQSLVLSDRGRFRLAHSGDVKVYENLDVMPRA
ncbi:MAG: hypothetical protein GX601_00740, partial [Anaerolineales bacterium]|nr:hypothetical protein [Anaerolineales bacterium]